ncbi:MAG: peptidase M48 Ste24p [Candidatus Electrothrix sp. AR4]|nr:peptidase M48 Ste24p [Candidatus Electrothrix sp. AR4]
MIYNNLIYFLTVIFILSTSGAPEQPCLAPWYGLPMFGLLLFAFYRIAGRLFNRNPPGNSKAYFATEKKLSILATLLFIASFFTFDIKYYLHPLSLGGTLPILTNLGGIILFFLFLVSIWRQAWFSYRILFNSSCSPANFIITNIKTNLTIILPWLALSLFFDLMKIIPDPAIQNLLNSEWGKLLIFCSFILFLAVIFPPAIRRLWNCTSMEPGRQRIEIEAFCRSQNFSSEILHWPLFEGKMVTAGIMGFVPKFRYLLLTPALLAVMDREELQSIVAHEIGHVKKYHLLLYILIFFGFSLLIGVSAKPLPLVLLHSDWFYHLLIWSQIPADKLLKFLSAAILLSLTLLYFRFLFGYFIRNFERQADLYVFKAQNSSSPLIRSFEKIAALSGNIRHKKNWHHFGIGERIAYLEQCENNRINIKLHDYKVYTSLAAYFILISLICWSLHRLETDSLHSNFAVHYANAMVQKKLKKEPKNKRWLKLSGDLMIEIGQEKKALAAYEKAFGADPIQTELSNNMAWLLLTAKDKTLRDSVRALRLARTAARFSEQGYILDTLATALWANGQVEEAVRTEKKAAEIDPKELDYYQAQMRRFKMELWRRPQ